MNRMKSVWTVICAIFCQYLRNVKIYNFKIERKLAIFFLIF